MVGAQLEGVIGSLIPECHRLDGLDIIVVKITRQQNLQLLRHEVSSITQ